MPGNAAFTPAGAAATSNTGKGRLLPLLGLDKDMLGFESVTTVTFYRGDAAAAARHLQARLADVVAANPWLAGTLVKTKGGRRWCGGGSGGAGAGAGGATCLAVPEPAAVPGAARRLFRQATDDRMTPEMDCGALAQHARRLRVCVKTGAALVGRPDEPLFLVTVVRLQKHIGHRYSQFAVVVSLAHCVGDGCTFYNIYGMLGSTAGVRRLDRRASPDGVLPRQQREAVFQKSKLALFTSLRYVLGLAGNVLFGSRVTRSVHVVPGEWIGRQKEVWSRSAAATAATAAATAGATAHDGGGGGGAGTTAQAQDGHRCGAGAAPTWVSTNDVLASSFLKRGGYDYAWMSLNLRGKFDVEGAVPREEQAALAGNHIESIHMFKDEMATPLDVRRAVTPEPGRAGAPLPRYHTARPDAPGTITRLKGNVAVVTNWSGFYTDMVLPGAAQIVHLPLFLLSWAGRRTFQGFAVIFRPNKNEVALYTLERGAVAEQPHAWDIADTVTFV